MSNSKPANRRRTAKPKSIAIAHADVIAFCALFAEFLAQLISEADVEGAFWATWARWANPEEVERAKKLIAPRDWD